MVSFSLSKCNIPSIDVLVWKVKEIREILGVTTVFVSMYALLDDESWYLTSHDNFPVFLFVHDHSLAHADDCLIKRSLFCIHGYCAMQRYVK